MNAYNRSEANFKSQVSVRNTIRSLLMCYRLLRALPSACADEMLDLPYIYPHIPGGSRSLYSLVGSRPHFSVF